MIYDKHDTVSDWENVLGNMWACPYCGYFTQTEGSWESPDFIFCPECGARVVGEIDG